MVHRPNRDRRIKDNPCCYCQKAYEMTNGKKGRWCRQSQSQAPWGLKPLALIYITSREARQRRASLLRRIVDGASAKTLKVCARFAVEVVSDRELFRFLLGIWRPRKALECPDTPFSFQNKHLRARKLCFLSGKHSR